MDRTQDGFFRILNSRQLERRSNQTDDPRWIFYSAMLSVDSVAAYRALVGELIVYPPTFHGKVTAENELRYAVYVRRWLDIASADAGQPDGGFVPDPARDERIRTIREIIQRQGQQKFRRELLDAYGGKCAISGCAIPQRLDAAHITPYRGPYTNHVQNGILLRTDLHTLWDLSLLAVDPITMRTSVAPSVRSRDAQYAGLHGRPVRWPESAGSRPSSAALETQWREFCKE